MVYLTGCFATPSEEGGVREHPFAELILPPPEPEVHFGDYSPRRYAWVLEQPTLFANPFPYKGALSLWDIDENLIRQAENPAA